MWGGVGVGARFGGRLAGAWTVRLGGGVCGVCWVVTAGWCYRLLMGHKHTLGDTVDLKPLCCIKITLRCARMRPGVGARARGSTGDLADEQMRAHSARKY